MVLHVQCGATSNSCATEPLVSSFLQYAGHDNVRTCKGTRETGLERQEQRCRVLEEHSERFGKTAGVAKRTDVFQFQWTSIGEGGGYTKREVTREAASCEATLKRWSVCTEQVVKHTPPQDSSSDRERRASEHGAD